MMAKLHGGDEENIDPGFEKKIKTLLPNTASVVATTPDMGEFVRTGKKSGDCHHMMLVYAFNFSKQGHLLVLSFLTKEQWRYSLICK